jgi:transcriptional regulator with XRE-family HTH domain
MAVATEKIIPGVLPPREETEGVDFTGIYDLFDASVLTEEQLLKFAPRNPWMTALDRDQGYYRYGSETYPVPVEPVTRRLSLGEFCVKDSCRCDILQAEKGWKEGKKNGYKNARVMLIKGISMKACTEYVRRQYRSMSPEEVKEEQENWDRWSRYCDERRAQLEELRSRDYEDLSEEERDRAYGRMQSPPPGYTFDYSWHRRDQIYIPVMSLKLLALRKALGLTQRDFAKRIGYNVNKYALLEQGRLEKLGFYTLREAFPSDFIKNVVDASYANPYWLEDQEEYSLEDVDPEETAMTPDDAVLCEEKYAMFVDAKVIRYWHSRKGL